MAVDKIQSNILKDSIEINYKIPIRKNGKVEYIDPAKKQIPTHQPKEIMYQIPDLIGLPFGLSSEIHDFLFRFIFFYLHFLLIKDLLN